MAAPRSPTAVVNAMNASLNAHGVARGTPNFNSRHTAADLYSNSKWPLPAGAGAAGAGAAGAGAAAGAGPVLTAEQAALIAAVTKFLPTAGQTEPNAAAVAAALTALGPAAGAGEPPKVADARAIALNIAKWVTDADKVAALAPITAATADFTAMAGGRRRGRKSRKATKKSKKATKKSKKSKKSKKAKKSRKTKGRK